MANARVRYPHGPILDSRGRVARYLRISITDRCNLRCVYCRNSAREKCIPHERILRFEHFRRLIRIGRRLGVGKIRITGGEPFARKGCVPFILSLRDKFPDLRLSVTTNATLLEPWLRDIRKAGLASINISIDSFERDAYASLTGADMLPNVLANMEKLLAMGQRVKINVVAIRGITDVQIDEYLYAARTLPLDIRFIEFMRMGSGTVWTEEKFLSCAELLRLASTRANLLPASGADPAFAGPAHMYAMSGAPGRIGFIAAMSGHFCESCNRLRVTSEGRLRVCLFADREYNLAPLLVRSAVPDECIALAVTRACLKKPLGSSLLARCGHAAIAEKAMTGIGG